MKWKITIAILTVLFVSCFIILKRTPQTDLSFQLDYTTFFGGSDDDRAHGVAIDREGNLYVVAPIRSGDFPVTTDALLKEPTGIYLARFNPAGELTYATYLGIPGGANYVHDVAIDDSGYVYIVGNTTNADFPVTEGAYQTIFQGPSDRSHGDAFVMKLSSDCRKVIYSTFIGGSGMDLAGKIDVDAVGCAYILGTTASPDLPVTPGAYDTSFNGGDDDGRDDLYIAKLNPAGSELIYCTYLGGSKTDVQGNNLILLKSGSVVFAGTTASDDFPTTDNAFDGIYNGGSGIRGQGDAVLVMLDPTGSKLEFSSYLGGSGEDSASNVAIDSKGYVWIAGDTNSVDFPLSDHAGQREIRGGIDGYITQLNLKDGSLLYSSLFGGKGDDYLNIATHVSGKIVISGRTDSPDFPVTTTSKTPAIGVADAFVSLIDPETSELKDSRVLGGSVGGMITAMTSHNDSLYLVGNTASPDFPVTANAWDSTFNGGSNPWGGDAFLIKMTLARK